MLVFRGKRDPAMEALSMEVRKMLGLDPQASEFNVVYGAIPRDDKEIAILTRSLLEVIIDLSADIEVPAAHVEEKRVSPTFVEERADGRKDSAFDPDPELIGKAGRRLCFGALSEFLFLDRRPGLDVQENLFLFDVCLYPGGDRGERGRADRDDPDRVALLSTQPEHCLPP